MHYIVYCSVDGLYVRHLGREDDTVAVTREKCVLDASPRARQMGVRPGMPKQEAKANVRGVEFIEWRADDDNALLEGWLTPLLEVTDHIEATTPHAAYLDITAHRDPMAVLERVKRLLPDGATVGIGASKWIARASASVGLLSADFVVCPSRALRRCPVHVLPIEDDVARRLVFLGYRTIGNLQTVECGVLKEQFGSIATTVYQACHGGVIQRVTPNFPHGTIRARLQPRCEWSETALRSMDLHRLATRLAQPLIDRDLTARRLDVEIDYSDGRSVRLERTFAKPMRTAQQILIDLEAVCTQVHGDVAEIRVSMSVLDEPARRQFGLEKLRVGEPGQSLVDTIAAVRKTFGHSSIQQASQIRLPRRRLVLKSWQDATGWK